MKMSKKYLILAMNDHTAHDFAKNNELEHTDFNIVHSPDELKEFTDKVTLLLLHYWDWNRSSEQIRDFNGEIFWFDKKNNIIRIDSDNLLKDEI